jgi:multiple sugar transport system ATP-binding protein
MAVMSGGVLQQYDTPERVFAHPVNTFVAGFVGSPAMNLVAAKAVSTAAGVSLRGGDGWSFALSAANAEKARRSTSDDVVLGARHSTIKLHRAATDGAIPGRVYTVEPTGDITFAHVYLGSAIVVVSVPPAFRPVPDEPLWIEFDQERIHLFDGKTEQALPAA